MKPSKATGPLESKRPSEEIGPTDHDGLVQDSEPQEHLKPLEDIAPVGDNGRSEDIGPLDNDGPVEDNTSLDKLEQWECTVPMAVVVPSENIEPSSSDGPTMLAPPGKDRRQSAAAHENLSEFKGKVGAYVYKPGTSTLVFRPEKKLGDNLKESKGETLLKAVRFGQVDGVELLLEANAWTEFKDDDGRTPLLCAVEDNNIVLVELLLRSKADWNAIDNSKLTALHLASLNGHADIVRKLLEIPEVDTNAQDEQNETALHLAVKNGHQSTIEWLLAYFANVNAKDKKGFTPLHLAAGRRGPTIVKLILGGKDIEVDARANNGRTPLMQACNRAAFPDCEKIVKLLLEKGADASASDHNGETPLFLSAWAGNWANLQYLISWKPRPIGIKALTEDERSVLAGPGPININALTEDHRSALFGPAKFGFARIADLLLEANINSAVESKARRTAFLESAKYDKVEVMNLILENLVEKHGQERGKIVQPALFEAAIYDSSRVARFLIEQGGRMDEKEPTLQKTAIEIANDHSSQTVVAVLLEMGDQLVSQGPSLATPLVPEAPSEGVDLGFGFQSTIASFSFDPQVHVDTPEDYIIARPTLQSVLYDQSPTAIKTSLQGAKSTSSNFRWLHVPSNNAFWVNSLISRMYKECNPPDQAKTFEKKCKHLFGEEVWTRHQYQMSSASVAHRRFIRPTCERIIMSETDDKNMMMALPYFHWETCSGRKEMRDVIIEAMRRHVSDPQPKSNLKGLNEALDELDKILHRKAHPKVVDPDDDTASDYSSYYIDSYTATSTNDPGRRASRRSGEAEKPEADPDEELVSRVASDAPENELIRAEQATVAKPEQEKRKKRRIRRIVDIAKESRSPDEKLILAYMFDEIPLHFRRTLDQYYYYTLPTTEARDTDQVVSRYFEKTWPEKDEHDKVVNENLVVMVDQLWLWILDNNTVITSFPQRWNKTEKKTDEDPDPSNASDIVESIIRRIGNKDRRPLRNVFDLTELIVSKCIGIMFEHPNITNEKLRFAEFFEVSIGNVMNQESKMFDDFTNLSKRLAKDDENIIISNELKADLKKLFDISEETKFLKEIKDIKDEIHIISTVLKDQHKVLVNVDEAIQAMKAGKTEGGEPKKPQTTIQSYHSLLGRIPRHLSTVEELDKQAEKTYLSLKDLLDLKQKQANVSEARTQGKQAAETARQGQTLMLFTVITVFFLPLSFMSSFFALDIAEFVRNDNGALGLGYVFEIMFPITVAVVAISLFFAFRWEIFLTFVTYCEDVLRRLHESLKKFLKYAWETFMLVVFITLTILCCCFPFVKGSSRRRRGRVEVTEEEYVRRRSCSPRTHRGWFGGGPKPASPPRRYSRSPVSSVSDSDEIVVVRRGKPSRYSPPRSIFARGWDAISGVLAILGVRRRTGRIATRERYGRRKSPSPRIHTGWLGGRRQQRTETVMVKERYPRRGDTSPVWQRYGDDERRSALKRQKWLPWAGFEKNAEQTRRTRNLSVGDERGSMDLKRIYAWFIGWFITPLLILFGKSQRVPERRPSGTSASSYASSASRHMRDSNGSIEGGSRRSRRI